MTTTAPTTEPAAVTGSKLTADPTGGALELHALDNLKGQIIDGEGRALPGDLYAKVVRPRNAAGLAYARFTAIPDGHKDALDRLHRDAATAEPYGRIASRIEADRVFLERYSPERDKELDTLRALSGRPVEHSFADWRPGDQRVFVADVRRAERALITTCESPCKPNSGSFWFIIPARQAALTFQIGRASCRERV